MAKPQATGRLGTFAGVFTPSILTILGIILFQRMGYIVGISGVMRALLIVGLATAISVLTAISLSAIATNIRVKKGGDYYLISRTLGAEFGGAIGLVLFAAQSVSIAFYAIGFGEAVSIMASLPEGSGRLLAAGAVLVLLVFAYLGADWATKFQYGVMAVLVLAIGAFFFGAVPRFDAAALSAGMQTPAESPNFWFIFALFFPAVTGFTQGVSMSGDLKDPSRSLPRGTFLAIAVSTVVYLAAVLAFAGAMPLGELSSGYDAMRRISPVPWLIDAGVIAATLSSAMASFLGAPRILQSLAQDEIFPVLSPFAKGVGASQNPRRGVLLTCVVAMGTVAAGSLNVIAPVVSMFFLVSYGLLNFATYYEAKGRSPSFRPRFKFFNGRVSLAGALACAGAMVAIDPYAGIVAAALFLAVREYLRRTGVPPRFSDSRYAYRFRRVREDLLALADGPPSPRDWRPHIIALSDDPDRRERLLKFASWIEGGSGLTTVVRVLQGSGSKAAKRRLEALKELRADLDAKGLRTFANVVTAETPMEGGRVLVQGHGLGTLHANTVLLNWLVEGPDTSRPRVYAEHLAMALRLGLNVVVLEAGSGEWEKLGERPSKDRRIDVWWLGRGRGPTSRLLLMLAYLMTRTRMWEDSEIRVLAALPAGAGEGAEAKLREEIEKELEEVRIDAELEIVTAPHAAAVIKHSADAGLVFLPLHIEGATPTDPFGDALDPLLRELPVTALAIAGEQIDLDAEPDDAAEETEEKQAEEKTAEVSTDTVKPESAPASP